MRKFLYLLPVPLFFVVGIFTVNAQPATPEGPDEPNAPTPLEAVPVCWLNTPYGIQDGTIVYVEFLCNLPAGEWDYLEIQAQYELNITGYEENPFTWDFSCASPPLASCGGRYWDVYDWIGTHMEIIVRSDKSGGLTTSRMKGPGQVRLGFGRIVITSVPSDGCVTFTPEFGGGGSSVRIWGAETVSWPTDRLLSHSTCGTFPTPTPPPTATPTSQPTATVTPGPTATPDPSATPEPTPPPAPEVVDCTEPGTYCLYLSTILNP